ncbi:MAG: DMT family transporter [Anaerolineae bacterium]|nr:DMT family transporter [Anaerolineae bacterium]
MLTGIAGYVMLPVWVKNIQPSGLLPLDIATWRFLFAMPVMWLILLALRTPPSDKPLPIRGLLGLGLLLAVSAVALFFGLERIPASTYILLFYTYPGMVALINFALGERMPLQSWLALVVTLTGVALTVPDFGVGLQGDVLAGVLIAFVNAFSVAIYFILINRWMRGHTSMRRASAWAITGAFLTMLVVLGVRGGVTVPPDTKTWVLLLLMALVSTVMPIFMFMNGIQRLGSSRAAIFSTVEPIGTMTVAALLLGETIQPIQLLGGAFILISILLLQVPLRRPAAVPAPSGGD